MWPSGPMACSLRVHFKIHFLVTKQICRIMTKDGGRLEFSSLTGLRQENPWTSSDCWVNFSLQPKRKRKNVFVFGLCLFSLHLSPCDKIPVRDNLREQLLVLADSFRGFRPWFLGLLYLGRTSWMLQCATGAFIPCGQVTETGKSHNT